MNHSEEIKSKIDIVELISSYLNLKQAGSNFRAICPFHNEKSPSFMVSPEKQIWHCFGCGKGGDIFSFVMEMEGLDFVETLKLLAPKAGVILENKNFSQDQNKNKLLEILELSQKYYNFILTSEKNQNKKILEIRKYLESRGLNLEQINNWGIGYSPDSFDDLLLFLKRKKFTDNEILLAGISFKNSKGNYYNRFRDRIMFPINDYNSRVVAFTARINPSASEQEQKMGKYINSPQTSLYDKSKILFGLDKAKKSIKEKKYVIIVEGQMDVITAYEAGFTNVVASSGTALTTAQLNLIKRYTNNIILSFDQDSAGSMATDRGVLEALKIGFNIKIASFGSNKGKDPDDIIRENPDKFKKYISESKHIIDHYLTEEINNVDLANARLKNESVNKILTVINMLFNKVEQDFWLKELSQKYDINENFLREELVKIANKSNKNNNLVSNKSIDKKIIQRNDENINNRDDKIFELLFSIILTFPQNFDYIVNNLNLNFIKQKYVNIYASLVEYCQTKKTDIDYKDFLLYIKDRNIVLSEELNIFLAKVGLLADFYFQDLDNDNIDIKVKKEISNLILEIKKDYYKREMDNIKNKLAQAEKDNNTKIIEELLNNLKSLNEELKKND